MDPHILSSLTCPICLELVEDAVETSCCHHVFCENCISPIQNRPCPQCRQGFQIHASHAIRRLVGNMVVPCSIKGCNVKIANSEIKEHEQKCEYRLYKCPAANCIFEGLRRDFAYHLASQHEENVVKNAKEIFSDNTSRATHINKDRVSKARNENGCDSRLGSNGKYYCGQRLNGPWCDCCNGHCGPTNGCNCCACMKLDVQARQLPKGWYVNTDGAACRVSPETRRLYCGRRVMGNAVNCDGYCGPDNGPNCQSCQNLQGQIKYRYATVWP